MFLALNERTFLSPLLHARESRNRSIARFNPDISPPLPLPLSLSRVSGREVGRDEEESRANGRRKGKAGVDRIPRSAKVVQTEARVSARAARCSRVECSRGNWNIGLPTPDPDSPCNTYTRVYTETKLIARTLVTSHVDQGLGRKRRILPWTASHPGYATLKFRRLVVVSLAQFHPAYEHDRPIFSHPLFSPFFPSPLIDTPIEDRTVLSSTLLFYSRRWWRSIHAAIRLHDSSVNFLFSPIHGWLIRERERERNVPFQFFKYSLIDGFIRGWTGRGDERASIPCEITPDSIGLNR